MRVMGSILVLWLGALTLSAQVPIAVSSQPTRLPVSTTTPTPVVKPSGLIAQAPIQPPQNRIVIASTDQPPPPPQVKPIAAVSPPGKLTVVPKPSGLMPVPPPPPPPSSSVTTPDILAPISKPVIDDGLGQLVAPRPGGSPVRPTPEVVRLRADTEPTPPSPPTPPPVPVVAPAATATPGPMLEKIGADSNAVGKPLHYEIVVRNPSPVPLNQVQVQEELPIGARCLIVDPPPERNGQRLVWFIGTLEPNTERRLTLEVEPAEGSDYSSVATASCSVSSVWQTRLTKPGLSVTKKGPDTAQVGDEVPFEITVTNPGTAPTANVLIRDRLPSGLQHPAGTDIEADLGTLKPGESRSITLKTIALRIGTFVNEVVVTADGGLQATAKAEVSVTQPGLQLRKLGPDKACLHRDVEHKLEVFNNGQAPATSVRITDTLPEGLELISASDGGTYDPNTRSIDWNLQTLQPNQNRTVSVRMRAKLIGDWVNKATARADRNLAASASAPVTVEGIPALMLEVVDIDDALEIGGETDFEVRVTNQGTSPVGGVTIRAILPKELQLLHAEGATPHHQNGQEVVFEPVPKLTARADCTYKLHVKAIGSGDLRSQFFLTSDFLTSPVLEEESTTVSPENPEPRR